MTTVHAAPTASLTAPAAADTMEIASPYDQVVDDIDFDIDVNTSKNYEDDLDFVLDDARPDGGVFLGESSAGLVDDDLMLGVEARNSVADDVMRDDNTLPDEHLTDASDIDYDDTEHLIDTTEDGLGAHLDLSSDAYPPTIVPENELLPENADGRGTTAGIDDGASGEDPYLPVDSATNHADMEEGEKTGEEQADQRELREDYGGPSDLEEYEDSPATVINEEPEETPRTQQVVDADKYQSYASGTLVSEVELTNIHGRPNLLAPSTNLQDTKNVSDKELLAPLENDDALNTEGHLPHKTDETTEHVDGATSEPEAVEEVTSNIRPENPVQNEDSHHVTPLHPITMMFEGNRLSLFPSPDGTPSETYLLKDENLVNVSISDLLRSCRLVLDNMVEEDDELEIYFADFDLIISEDSVDASSTSFNDILVPYVELHDNDDKTADPFLVTLSTRPRFSRRLKLLQKLITEKKTITEYYLLTKTKYSEDPRADDDRSSDPYHVSMEPGAAAKGAEDGDALGHKSSENEGGEVHRLREENDLASAEEYDPESNTVFDDSLEEGEGAETKAEDQQIHDNNNGIGNGPDPRESSDVAQPITNTREYHPHPNTDAKPDSASYDDIVEEAEHNTDADREPDGQRVAHESEKQTASGHHSASSDRGTGQVTDGTKDGNGQNTRHGKGSETKNLTMADRRQNLSLGKEASIMPYAIRPGGPPGNFNTVDGDLRHDAIEHDMSGLADGNTESEVQISSRPVDEANKAYTLTSEAPEADVSQRSSVTATGHESSPTQLEEQLNTDEAEAGGNFTAAFDLDDTLYEPDLATDNESEIAFPYEEVDELGVDEQPEDEVAQHSHTTKDNPDSLSLLPGRRSPSTSSKRSRDDTELQSETVEDASNGTKRVRSQR